MKPEDILLKRLYDHREFLVRILQAYAVMKQSYEREITGKRMYSSCLDYVQSYGHMCMSMGGVLECLKENKKEINEVRRGLLLQPT